MYDYIIVGAGSSGCACAARLIGLLPDIRIALIESGEDYLASPDADFAVPENFPKTWSGPADRGYRGVPQKALNDRRLSIYRAAAVGGCSVVNAMIWSRGFKADWDKNMPTGSKGEDIEKEFNWLEARIAPVKYDGNVCAEMSFEAAKSLGYEKAKHSLWDSPGFTRTVRITIDESGNRQDIYRALGADDSRITLVKGTAEKLIFEHSAEGKVLTSGVMIRLKNDFTEEVRIVDGGEVILSCGSIDSPKLLQISGVGPKSLMEKLGIPLVLDRPVGEGLKDHVMFITSYETLKPFEKLSPNSTNGILYDESLHAQFVFCDGHSAPCQFPMLLEPLHEKIPSTTWAGKAKDYFVFAGMTAICYILTALSSNISSFRSKIQKESYSILVNLMKPESTGSVMVTSKNPKDMPAVDSAFLKETSDMQNMLKAVAKARELAKAPPLASMIKKETVFAKGDTDEEKIRNSAMSYHHSTGTCASCLDEEFRFKEIKGLRVADASSLAFHPRAPTNASSMAVGARCASLIAKSRK